MTYLESATRARTFSQPRSVRNPRSYSLLPLLTDLNLSKRDIVHMLVNHGRGLHCGTSLSPHLDHPQVKKTHGRTDKCVIATSNILATCPVADGSALHPRWGVCDLGECCWEAAPSLLHGRQAHRLYASSRSVILVVSARACTRTSLSIAL